MGDALSPFRCVHPDGEGTVQRFARVDDFLGDVARISGEFVRRF